jgi:RNA polymerase sigma-70 factor (ECF subfamily)
MLPSEDPVLPLTQAEFNRLVDLHSAALYRMAYRMMGDRHEAEDMVQEAFRSAWKGREGFEPQQGERAWLAAILRRRIIDRWRRRAPPATAARDQTIEISVESTDPLQLEYTDEMQAALAVLPLELRETLLLVIVGELTHQETADLLGLPLGTVLSRVSRARRRLRDTLMAARSQPH